MENFSILEKIINNQKAEEIAKLNAIEIINNLFSELTDRERDILTRRFGLKEDIKDTLETVGQAHQLTRERIRQIEVTSVKKLRQLSKLEDYVSILNKVITQLLEEHGGIMEKDYLFEVLTSFSVESDRNKDEKIHKNNLDFLISKLLHDHFEELNNHAEFKDSYKLKFQELDHMEELAEELLVNIKEIKDIYKTHELIDMFKDLGSYEKHRSKIDVPCNIDISSVLRNDFYEEKHDVINENKPLYSLLKALKHVEQNKFGHWGVNDSREIKPKTINDKIYLVLKEKGEPMHFVEISERINEVSFDKKKANPATVHNELILDDKYVLVGRGLYSLKEWGYKKGTVADVILELLKDNEVGMTREEIIEKVLERRTVKKTTIVLALMNKDKFQKTGENKYIIIKGENNISEPESEIIEEKIEEVVEKKIEEISEDESEMIEEKIEEIIEDIIEGNSEDNKE